MAITRICASAHHLPMIADESVHVIVTSPPYFSLRKYSGNQEVAFPEVTYSPMPGMPEITIPAMTCDLGLEERIEEFIGHLVLCLREWHRILRADGTCWVNLGDSYANTGVTDPSKVGGFTGDRIRRGVKGTMDSRPRSIPFGLKPKNLMMVPARFALAAQAEGWILRSDLIWSKPNPMPESVTDRMTKSHEYIFMLAKQERYFWDAEAVKEPNQIHPNSGWAKELEAGRNPLRYSPQKSARSDSASTSLRDANLLSAGRNMRSVLRIPTQSFSGAHFATWPERIPEIAILAGTSAVGVCPQCGAGYVRITQKPDMSQRPTRSEDSKYPTNGNHFSDDGGGTLKSAGQAYQDWRNANPDVTTGWQPACECNAGEPVSATVCDPFSGSGTSGKVALRLGRSYIGVDISDSYLTDITDQRLGDGIQMEMAL